MVDRREPDQGINHDLYTVHHILSGPRLLILNLGKKVEFLLFEDSFWWDRILAGNYRLHSHRAIAIIFFDVCCFSSLILE